MSRSSFRGLLWSWVVVFGLRFMPWPSHIPVDIETVYLHSLTVNMGTPAGILFVGAFLFLLVVGVIGMFRFWRPAPYVFFSAPLLAYLMTPLTAPGWFPLSGWEAMFEGFATLLAGIIFATAVNGSAKDLFVPTRNNAGLAI